MQWKTNTEHVQQDLWFDYQQVITPSTVSCSTPALLAGCRPSETSPVAFLYQFEAVHHGGQQFELGHGHRQLRLGPGVLLRAARLPLAGHGEPRGLRDSTATTGRTASIQELTIWGKGVFARALRPRTTSGAATGSSGPAQTSSTRKATRTTCRSATTAIYREQRNYVEMGLAKRLPPGTDRRLRSVRARARRPGQVGLQLSPARHRCTTISGTGDEVIAEVRLSRPPSSPR